MPPAPDIRLVCFDLGRVLIRICDDWQHACRVAGVPSPSQSPDAAAVRRLHELVTFSDTGDLDLHGFATAAAPMLGLQAVDLIAMSNAFLLGPFPGVSELIADLESRRIPTACLSNTNANHWRLMTDATGPNALPLHRLTHRFASHLLGLRKPDAAIYEHVERETGLGGPQILFFDDLPENVAAANERGWRGVRVETHRDPMTQMRETLRELAVL